MSQVAMEGLKAQFHIPFVDVIFANNMPFIRLRTQSWTLPQAVFEDNPDLPVAGMHASGFVSLVCCNGLNMLVQMRNEAQVAHIVPQGGSTLFDVVEVKKPKKARLSWIEIQAQRDAQIPISIDSPLDGIIHPVPVLRLAHPKDALYLACVASSLGVVLKYLRVNGFTYQTAQLGC